MRLILLLTLFLSACAVVPPPPKADFVLVEKSTNQMHLYQNGKILKTYDVAFGLNPIGHKERRGDLRTPEGRYMIDYKNYNSKFYKSLNISYPNEFDILRAQSRGDDPGDDIVIHGMPNEVGNYTGPITPRNWTEGCIAVRNHEMDELFRLIDVDTPIEIRP
jgi:murein L,D-transpeptidase YafK